MSSRPLWADALLPIVALSLVLAGLPGCGGGGAAAEVPVAALGTPLAEQEFRPLMRRWTLADTQQRIALDRRLTSFVNRHKDSPLVRQALALRAWNALERGDLDEARRLASEPLAGPAGVARDLATLVVGAVERRSGNPENALLRLTPLLHKMLDEFATSLLNEELVQAALGARRWLEAVQYMEAWQREVEPGNERLVRDRVRELLAQLPKEALLAALDERAREGTLESDAETATLLAQQLAVLVVADRDNALARIVLDRFGPLLGSYGESVARLAADTTRGQVRERTVGVLLSYRTSAMRRRSADVVAGMSFGLGLPGSQAHLVTRDGGSTSASATRAMAELAASGAPVIVAGVDPEHSAAAVAFGVDNALPVILLTPDPEDNRGGSPFAFLLGQDPRRSMSELSAALRADGAAAVGGIGAALRAGQRTTGGLGVGFERDCDELPEPAELRSEGIDALLVFDGAYCTPAVARLADALNLPLGIGLGAAPPAERRPRARVLASGVFPVDPAAPDPRLAEWLDRRGAPSWWHALGRDAAVLSWLAVRELAAAGESEDDRELKARRLEATSALATAEAELWTSDARGFGGSQQLARKLTVQRGAPGAR